jgi:hypothetical protein
VHHVRAIAYTIHLLIAEKAQTHVCLALKVVIDMGRLKELLCTMIEEMKEAAQQWRGSAVPSSAGTVFKQGHVAPWRVTLDVFHWP